MTQPAISVDRLGKRYRLGQRPNAYRTLRDALGDLRRRRDSPEEIWALHDVSFEIEPGEPVGIIGANGAGKTTLLKILSRITTPTTGRARVRGRVGALLEVGTGFHPELTGRENVYLNGAILGMSRREVTAKFDDIVSFAEVESFIDTPVKRYSSGMYVRLAFAVAAHLEPDILLVDEVISVGDYAFQQRCLGKMEEEANAKGRTVLFVSHNLAAISAVTHRCIWLEKGRVRQLGPTSDVFRDYVLSFRDAARGGRAELADGRTGRPRKPQRQDVLFHSLELRDRDGNLSDTHFEQEPIQLVVSLEARAHVVDVRLELYCRFNTLQGVRVFTARHAFDHLTLDRGVYGTSFWIDPNPLAAGTYSVELYAMSMSERASDRVEDQVERALTLHVQEWHGGEENLRFADTGGGVIRVEYQWSELAPAAPRASEPERVGTP